MGKKNSNKSKFVNASGKTSKILPFNKRKEITDNVKILLQYSSQVFVNAKDEWENYMEVFRILEKIRGIEIAQTPKNREDHFKDMIEWIKSNGGMTDNVVINNFENMEYGLQAAKDLAEGELVCSVPSVVMMTLENVKESPLKSLYNQDPILRNMGNVALALFLILEYLKDRNSFWYHYISSLPERYNTVLYFTPEDFKELKQSPVYEPALKHCRNIARQYAYFYQVFQKSDDEASRSLRHHFTYELYRWAVSTVMTRQNYILSKDKKNNLNALIPLWDMCNHSNGFLTTQFKHDSNVSECLAFRSFREGEQVLIFYGQRSNADFFLHNGFVYPENDHDTYCLKLGVSKADRLYDARIRLLNHIGIPANAEFYLYSKSEPLDWNLLAFLRVFNMDEGNLNYWLESDRSSDLGCMDCAMDTEIECKVWNFLYNRIKLLLSGYSPTSKSDDKDVSQGLKSVRLLREVEIKLLESVLEYVQQRLKIDVKDKEEDYGQGLRERLPDLPEDEDLIYIVREGTVEMAGTKLRRLSNDSDSDERQRNSLHK